MAENEDVEAINLDEEVGDDEDKGEAKYEDLWGEGEG